MHRECNRSCGRPNHKGNKATLPPPPVPPNPALQRPARSGRGLPSPRHCLAKTHASRCVRSSSQECFEVAQTRAESTSKRDGERDEEASAALFEGSEERRMLLQVSSLPSGSQHVPRWGPTGLCGASHGSSFLWPQFAPPWLKRFLSSLWFPFQRRCPAAAWERPGEASCPRRLSTEEGDPRWHPVSCSTPGILLLAPAPRCPSLIPAVLLAPTKPEPHGATVLPIPSPCCSG